VSEAKEEEKEFWFGFLV